MSSITLPTSGAVADWFTNLETYLQDGWNSVVSAVQGFLSGLVPFLDLVQADLPVLATELASFANLLTTAFPNGGITPYLTQIEAVITDVEGYVQTAAGVIMSLVEAKTIGAAINPTPLTGAQKMSVVLKTATDSYPNIPESVHRQAIEVSLGRIKSKVSITKP